MPETSIVISAKDNFSQTILTLRNASTAFNKDLEGLSKKLGELDNTKHTIKLDLDKAKRELKETEKAFRNTDEAARDDTALREAEEKYDNLRRQLAAVGQEAKQTEKDIMHMSDANNRASNRAFGSSSSGGKGSLAALSKAGIGAMFGNSLGQLADAGISSAFGDATGTMISSTLSGAITGGAMGSIAGPAGTLVGGLVGGISGAISAGAQNFAKEDGAFKSYTNDQYQRITGQRKTDLQTGSGIAAERESSLISFTTLFGDKDTAAKYLDEMKTMANTTPFLYDDLAQMSKVLKTYGYSVDELIPQLTRVGDAGAALGLSPSDMSMVATAIGRMNSSDKTTLKYLNPLVERGIPAIDYLADELQKTPQQIYEAISKGTLSGKDSARIISEAMGKAFDGSMEAQSKTFSGLSSTLQGWQQEMQAAMGEGYNEVRARGMQEQIKYFESPGGGMMEDAYAAIGRRQGDLENLKEQYERDAFSYLMDPAAPLSKLYQTPDNEKAAERMKAMRQEYKEASKQDDGGKMDSLLAEAQSIAENAYHADTNTQTEMKRQTDLLSQIKINTAFLHEYWNADYLLAQAASLGVSQAADLLYQKKVEDWTNKDATMSKDEFVKYNDNLMHPPPAGAPRAMGVQYVPRDNYLIRAHEGERLLTAQEARGYGSGASVTVTGNQFTVREEADIDRIAREIVRQFELQRMASGLSAQSP